jgi:TPR repeat protein
LGELFFTGKGVKKDYKEAVNWLKKASDQNHPRAQYALGGCYLYGNGVKKSRKNCEYWFRKSAEQGFWLAQTSLGALYLASSNKDDIKEAAKWLEMGAQQGDQMAKLAYEACLDKLSKL